MVKGRRVRAVAVTVAGNDDCCSPNPKRKDLRRLDISNSLRSPKNKTTVTITQYFQAVTVTENSINNNNNNSVNNKAKNLRNGNNLDCENNGNSRDSTPVPTDLEIDERLIMICNGKPATPHRIELCQDVEEFQQNGCAPKIIVPDKKPVPPKAKRKLNNQHDTTHNQKLTDFFPVRRSERKNKKTVLEEKQRSLEHLLRNNIEQDLEIHTFEGKGRGILALREFFKGDFVVEYSGELIDLNEAKKREAIYSQDQNTGCYMYYFKHKGQQYCIDATAETGKLGRLVNHSRNGNLITRTISVDNKPRLILVAKDDIRRGQELTYDYGDRSKESLKHHPWLAL